MRLRKRIQLLKFVLLLSLAVNVFGGAAVIGAARGLGRQLEGIAAHHEELARIYRNGLAGHEGLVADSDGIPGHVVRFITHVANLETNRAEELRAIATRFD